MILTTRERTETIVHSQNQFTIRCNRCPQSSTDEERKGIDADSYGNIVVGL